MILNSFRLIALLMNAALVFYTAAFIVEGILVLFRVKNSKRQPFYDFFFFFHDHGSRFF